MRINNKADLTGKTYLDWARRILPTPSTLSGNPYLHPLTGQGPIYYGQCYL